MNLDQIRTAISAHIGPAPEEILGAARSELHLCTTCSGYLDAVQREIGPTDTVEEAVTRMAILAAEVRRRMIERAG
jgi:hypothetical protein